MDLLFILQFFLLFICHSSAVGRPPKIPYEKQKQIFIKYTKCLQDPDIKYNDPIFTHMSKELDYKMTPMALYLALSRQRNSIFVKKDQYSNSVEEMCSQELSARIPTPNTLNLTLGSKIVHHKLVSKTFSFNLDIYDWKKIQPLIGCRRRTGVSSHRTYKTLPKYKWSCMLKEKIWLYSKLPCTLTLKKNKINNDQFKLLGKCSQCAADIVITNEKKTDKIMTILCKVSNFDNLCKHNPKIKTKLTPYRRRQIAKDLQYKPCTMVRNIMASQLIDDNEHKTPPVLVSPSAFRKIKSDARKELLPHSDQILSLLTMARTNSDINKIREICVFPYFCLCFWSDNQIKYYNNYQTKLKKVTLTINATGSFFETIYLPDRTPLTKKMFLYVGLVTANEKFKSVPVFQMVTDSHSQDTILFWLKKWLSFINNPPQEIITDDCAALVSACVQAFALSFTTKRYIQHLFSVFEGKTSEKPKAFIRLDTSHFIKNLHRSFDVNVHLSLKYFYIRCVIFLKKCENFQLIKNTITDIISVCLSQYDEEDTTDNESPKSRLYKLISDIELEDPCMTWKNETVVENLKEDPDKDGLNDKNSEFTLWLDNVVESAKRKNQIVSHTKNTYFYPPFISTFKRILWKLPLWSNLACSFFESENKAPSSSGIESHFKSLKHLVFKTKVQKYRVDEFLKLHGHYIDGDIKLALCDLNQDVANKITREKTKYRKGKIVSRKSTYGKRIKYSKLSKPSHLGISKNPDVENRIGQAKFSEVHSVPKMNTFYNDSIFADQPSYIENWKGQARDTKDKQVTKLKFLANGNLCDSLYINYQYVEVKNTCAFDSVMYLLSTAYNENSNIQDLLSKSREDELIPQYIKLLCLSDSKDDDIYILRAKVIQQYLQNPPFVKENHLTFYCECNAANIFERFPLQYFSSAVFTKQCVYQFCRSQSIKRNTMFVSLNLDIIKIFGISSLEDAVFFDEDMRKCTYCDGLVNCNYEISKLISFDLNGTDEYFLSEIPRSIIVKNKIYTCVGAIEFIPSLIPGGIGHYKCHTLVNERNVCYDNNSGKIAGSSKEKMYLHIITYALIDTSKEE